MAITCLADQLERDEGRKRSAYPDSLGYLTIGVGVCIDSRKGCGLTDQEINLIRDHRIAMNAQMLSQEYPWTDALDDVRRGALLNMVYQMGLHGVGEFHDMLAALQQGQWEQAANEALDSTWAKVQSPARAQRLALQFRTGEWQ